MNIEITSRVQETKATDYEVRSLDTSSINESELNHPWWHNLKYVVAGTVFGIILIKAEVVSWFRIQEMFRFQSFHMYGVIGSAIAVALPSVYLIRRFKVKTIYGEPIEIQTLKQSKGNIIGGLLFGVGWALTGACPGPLFGLLGTGSLIILVPILAALSGTWVYGLVREKLPH